MSQIDINNVLSQIRSISAQAKIGTGPAATGALGNAVGPQSVNKSGASEFANLLRQGIDQVNQTQQSADALATAFQKGTPGVELPQVMLEMQKASVSFRAVTEVRNRLVNAYQEIMNMPI
jgi:flagellar hook-basal body complex protein FliE